MDYKQGTCIEIAKGDGTYIGLFEEVKDGILVMKDVMKINLTPVPSEQDLGNFTCIINTQLKKGKSTIAEV